MSFYVEIIAHSGKLLPGGVKEYRSSRFGTLESLKLYLDAIMGIYPYDEFGDIEFIESKEYPELFEHCGKELQSLGGKCSHCQKILTEDDAKKYQYIHVGSYVELSPACDLWARGARFGHVEKVSKTGIASVRMFHPQIKQLQKISVKNLKRG